MIRAEGSILNRRLHRLVSQKLGIELTVPPDLQIVGSLGAALVAEQMERT